MTEDRDPGFSLHPDPFKNNLWIRLRFAPDRVNIRLDLKPWLQGEAKCIKSTFSEVKTCTVHIWHTTIKIHWIRSSYFWSITINDFFSLPRWSVRPFRTLYALGIFFRSTCFFTVGVIVVPDPSELFCSQRWKVHINSTLFLSNKKKHWNANMLLVWRT